MTLSVAIIGHNEAEHLSELLPQLHWADEVIYVDCESADDSLKIAAQNQCRTFSRPNHSNLNRNKTYAIEQAQGDWVMYLDPDERIPEGLSQEICAVIQSKPPHVAFQLNRRNHYFGRWLRHGSQYPDVQLRLFLRGKAVFQQEHVHEKLQVEGSIGHLHHDMLHYPYQTISQFLKKFDFYTSFEAHYLRKKNTPLTWKNHGKYLILTPLTRFLRRYFLKRGFLDGLPGFFCALFDALNSIVRYFKLWELSTKDAPSTPPHRQDRPRG